MSNYLNPNNFNNIFKSTLYFVGVQKDLIFPRSF